MSRGLRRHGPVLTIGCIALFAVLGGSVYAAQRIDGRSLKVKSLPGNRLKRNSVPGNRLKLGSVPGNRLKPGSVPGNRIQARSITGTQIDVSTLDQVPSAVRANSADSARDAETALVAASTLDAKAVNGRRAGCEAGTRLFAGACWQVDRREEKLSAPAAALSCANQGGELPGALELAAYSRQPGTPLAPDGEWTGDVTNVSGNEVFGVVTVSAAAAVNSALSTETRHYRCVIPLLH